jgi:hypothetical protein
LGFLCLLWIAGSPLRGQTAGQNAAAQMALIYQSMADNGVTTFETLSEQSTNPQAALLYDWWAGMAYVWFGGSASACNDFYASGDVATFNLEMYTAFANGQYYFWMGFNALYPWQGYDGDAYHQFCRYMGLAYYQYYLQQGDVTDAISDWNYYINLGNSVSHPHTSP